MRALLRNYLTLMQTVPIWAYHLGFSAYLLLVQLPCLILDNPGGKGMALLMSGAFLSGFPVMAWARWSSLPGTVPQHETIEEHK